MPTLIQRAVENLKKVVVVQSKHLTLKTLYSIFQYLQFFILKYFGYA